MLYLKQGTVANVPIGPAVDETDGKTQETALSITQPDVQLSKNGGTFAQKSAASTASHIGDGWYSLSLSTTDTNTLGPLVIAVHEAGALPMWRECMVVSASTYDSLFGAGALDVNVASMSANTLTSTAVDSSAVTELQTGLALQSYANAIYTHVTTYIDAAVSSRLAAAGYTAPPAASVIADAVLDEALSGHTTPGTAGAALSAAGSGGSAPSAADIRAELDANSTKLANLDATVSSRLASAGYTAPPSAATIRADLDANSTKLANLDATISSRLATSGYTAPPSAAAIRTEMDSSSTKLANLDATISSRLATSGYTAPTAAPTAAAIRAEMDTNSTRLAHLDADVSTRLAAGDYSAAPSASAVADAVWNEPQADHLTSGTVGAALNAAGSTGDNPWETALPGSYGPGTAGYIIGTNLDAAVSSVGGGGGGGLDAAGVRAALGLASANLDTQLADLATSSDIAALEAVLDLYGTQLDEIQEDTAINLPADIATRLAASGYTAPPSVAAIRAEMDANSTKLANLDTTVSSRLPTSSYTAPSVPPTAAAIRAELDANSTKLANLDATISSRLATAGYTAPPTAATIWGHGTRTLSASSDPTAGTIAAAVADELLAGHSTPGTLGKGISDLLSGVTLTTSSIDAIFTRPMVEAYSAKGGTLTLAQHVYETSAMNQQMSISGNTVTLTRRDAATVAFTLQNNHATSPSAKTRQT